MPFEIFCTIGMIFQAPKLKLRTMSMAKPHYCGVHKMDIIMYPIFSWKQVSGLSLNMYFVL